MGAQDAKITVTVDGGQLATDTFKQIKGSVESLGDPMKALGEHTNVVTGKFGDFKAVASGAFDSPVKGAENLIEVLVGSGGAVNSVAALAAVSLTAAGVLAGVGVALFELAEHAAGIGSQLGDLSDKTGVSVPALSRLANAAVVAGSSVGELSDAIYKMDVQATESPDKFADGLKKLGLEAKDFLALNPEDRLTAFASALANTGDAATRNAAGFEVMGKQFKDMGPKLLDLAKAMELTGGISVWSQQQADEAEAFEMQLKALKLQASDLGISIGRELIPAMLALIQAAKDVKEFLPRLIPDEVKLGVHAVTEEVGYLSAAWDLLRGNLNKGLKADSLDELAKKAKELKDRLFDAARTPDKLRDAMLKPIEGLTFSVQDLESAWKEETRANTVAVEAAKKAAEEAKRHAEAVAKVREKLHELEFGYYGLSTAIEKVGILTKDPERAAQWSKEYEAVRHVEQAAGDLGTALEHVGKKIPDELTKHILTFSDVLEETLKQIPNLLILAFEGGGGVEGALKSFAVLIGHSFAKSLIETIQADLKAHPLSSGLSTGALKDAGGVGLMAGIAAAASGGSTSHQLAEVGMAAAGVAVEVATMTTATIASSVALGAMTFGIGAAAVGLVALAKHFLTVSQSEKDARKAFEEFNDKIGGKDIGDFIDRVSAAGAALGKNGEEVRQLLVKLEEATHQSPQAVADALKPLTELIDAADQKTAALKTGFEKLTSAAQAFGRQLPAGLQASIRALLDMKGVTEDERKALQQVLDAGQVNFKTLTDKAAGFGITLDGLGPKFQQVSIDSRSKDLTDFLTDATAAGGDVGGMLAGLSDEISSLVNDSIKFGTAIPDNMKPYIEELIRAGKLTDENGKKIDDITGISFEATPLDQGLKGLTDAIQDLIDLLSGKDGVTDALAKIGGTKVPPIHVGVEWDVPDLPRAPIGPPQDDGGHFRVTTPTLFPVALHGPEDVMFSGENRAFAGRGDTTVVVLRADSSHPDDLYAALPDYVKHNTRGVRTRLMEALS